MANSKHDFFSIKNYDIIIGRVGDRLPCHNFQIIIFHKKSIWFSFFLTLSWRNKGKRHGHKTWQKVIWLIQSSKYKSRMKPSSVYYTLYVNNLLLRVFMYPIPLDTVENEPQELYFFLFCHNYLRVGGYLRSDDFVIELFVIIR